MQVELNFELPQDLTAKQHRRLLDLAIVYLVNLAVDGSFSHRAEGADYTDPHGDHVQAATHVVRLDKRSDVVDFEAHIAALSYALRQDCIAIRYEDGNGTLEGPAADKWGSFNPEFFVRF